MKKENDIKDNIQACLSIWFVALGLLYFSYPDYFFRFFIISLLAWVLIILLFVIVRKRKFGYIFRALHEKKIISRLRGMNSYEFEDFVADIYTKLGYQAERVSGAEFGGIDILISGKDGEYYLVCKNFISPDISRDEVAVFYETLLRHRVKGKMIAVGNYDQEAITLANKKGIDIIDGKRLVHLILKTINNKSNE